MTQLRKRYMVNDRGIAMKRFRMDSLQRCPELLPPGWLVGGHLQTIVPALFGGRLLGSPPAFARERWTTPDNDFIDLDWQRLPDGAVHDPHTSDGPRAPGPAPLLVLFHGLEGSSRSPYAQAFAQVAAAKRWDYLVVHFRGCSGSLNHAPRAYHSGDSPEIDWILRRLASAPITRSQIMAVGISLGGNALMRWAGEQGASLPESHRALRAVAAISSPLDLAAAGKAIDQGINRWLYARHFLATMTAKAKAKHDQFPGLFAIDRVRRAKTLRDFDDAFTAPLHGYRDVDDYWERASAKPVLDRVVVPALLVNAQNDPFVPVESLPTKAAVARQTTVWRPRLGGHVGFPGCGDRQGSWPAPTIDLMTMPWAVGQWFSTYCGGLGCAGGVGEV
jgi:predicted alpha/beta-fold hydrolase